MSAAVFVDTNVFVYARDANQPRKQPLAASWLDFLWREQTGRTSVQVLSEYYVTVTRKLEPGLDPEDAWDDVRGLMSWQPTPIDHSLLVRARDIERRYRLHWWDCMIVSAAQIQNCALLLSEDLQDGGEYGGVVVRSPFTLAVSEASATYMLAMPATGRHPGRGRPRSRAQHAASAT